MAFAELGCITEGFHTGPRDGLMGTLAPLQPKQEIFG